MQHHHTTRNRSRVLSMPCPFGIGAAGSIPAPSSITVISSMSPTRRTDYQTTRIQIARDPVSNRILNGAVARKEARHHRAQQRIVNLNSGRSRSENRACSIATYCRTKFNSSPSET